MKKFLPIAFALLASGAFAAPSSVESQIFYGEYTTGISDNGKWIVGQLEGDGPLYIRNLETDQLWQYGLTDGKSYITAFNRVVSDDGVVIGTVDDYPAFWKNGRWAFLPLPADTESAAPGSITPDGSMIVGGLSSHGMNIDGYQSRYPCVWYRNDKGTYDDPVMLPNISKDYFGLIPQEVQCIDVSADGKTIGVSLTCWSGFFHIPYVYQLQDNGEWTYKAMGIDLINPENIPVPEYPGDYEDDQPQYPDWEKYLNEKDYPKEYAAMWRAFPAWVAEQEKLGLTDEEIMVEELYFFAEYMTDENKAAFLPIVEEFVAAYVPWLKAFTEYQEFQDKLYETGVDFIKNNVFVSPDGKYIYATAKKTIMIDPSNDLEDTKYAPARGDVATGESIIYDYANNVLISDVTEDYSVLGRDYSIPSDPYLYVNAYIFPQNSTESVSIPEYWSNTENLYAFDWMEENLYAQVATGYNGDTPILGDRWSVGKPLSTPDMSLMAFTTSTLYWIPEPDESIWLTALLNTGLNVDDSAVEGVYEANEVSINVLKGGLIEINGEIAELNVYDLSGAKVYGQKAPKGVINTSLNPGVYVVTAVTPSGKPVTVKALL